MYICARSRGNGISFSLLMLLDYDGLNTIKTYLHVGLHRHFNVAV